MQKDNVVMVIALGFFLGVVVAVSWIVIDFHAMNERVSATIRKEAEECKPFSNLTLDAVPAKCFLYFQGK